MDREDVLRKFLSAAREAAVGIMEIYRSGDLGAELKGPNDPVTRADKEANALLLDRLTRGLPGIPIVAEESPPSAYAGFGDVPCAMFVDPVDGTRDFIERDGEFCVMIGLAEEGRATVGVVLCPDFDRTYAGIEGVGAFLVDEDDRRTPIHVSALTDLAQTRCAVSRFHRSKSVDAKLRALGVKELVPVGSSGIKGVKVASGELEIYAHPSKGLVKLWDACAPDAIARAAGAIYTDATGKPFDYRGAVAQGSGTLAASPALHAEALRRFASTERVAP
jgi:3'(2'), 5'-bisphosphate nucleotidase